MRVMVTQTWSWFRAQLDYPKSKRIKLHILGDSNYSLCGLENYDDEGEMEALGVLSNIDMCKKCRRLYERAGTKSSQPMP
jgi:hypothetical protein